MSPTSVHTEGVLAVILGLANSALGNLDVYVDQFLCAGCGDHACCLAPVQAKRSLAQLFAETNMIDSAQFSLSPESGPGGSRGAPDAFRGLLDAPPELPGGAPKVSSGIHLPGFFLQGSSSEIPPQGILLEDSSSRIPPPGFHL